MIDIPKERKLHQRLNKKEYMLQRFIRSKILVFWIQYFFKKFLLFHEIEQRELSSPAYQIPRSKSISDKDCVTPEPGPELWRQQASPCL